MHLIKAAARRKPGLKEYYMHAAKTLDMDAPQEKLSFDMNDLSIHIQVSGVDKYPGNKFHRVYTNQPRADWL